MRYRLAAVAAAALALTGATAASAHPAPPHRSGDVAVHASKRCTVHIHWDFSTVTVNGRGPWALSRFRTGTGTCGLDQRAAVQHCPGSPCPWAHGNWKAADGENSNAQAPAGSTMEWFYVEFRSNSTGTCRGHWTIYPVLNNNLTGGCP